MGLVGWIILGELVKVLASVCIFIFRYLLSVKWPQIFIFLKINKAAVARGSTGPLCHRWGDLWGHIREWEMRAAPGVCQEGGKAPGRTASVMKGRLKG